MKSKQDEHQLKQIDVWIRQNASGLPSEKLVRLFEQAIRALYRRTLITLSDVTLSAIFDRVLYQSQQKFPLLSGVKLGSEGVSLDGLRKQLSSSTSEPRQIIEAFRFFLVEFLTILGNLTGGILTGPLYQELTKVTAKSIHSESDGRSHGLKGTEKSPDREDL